MGEYLTGHKGDSLEGRGKLSSDFCLFLFVELGYISLAILITIAFFNNIKCSTKQYWH